jgi:hypothetical protein
MQRHVRFAAAFRASRFLVALVLLSGPGIAVDLEVPPSLSSSRPERTIEIPTGCPTFVWWPVEGAASYELSIFRQIEFEPDGFALEPHSVLRASLPAGTSSWTPASDLCLSSGATYAWSLRVLSAGEVEPAGIADAANRNGGAATPAPPLRYFRVRPAVRN